MSVKGRVLCRLGVGDVGPTDSGDVPEPDASLLSFTSTSTDKAGRSVPAPGRGALSIAREVKSEQPLPILNLEYRARQLAFRRKQIAQWLSNEQELLRDEAEFRKSQGEATSGGDSRYLW